MNESPLNPATYPRRALRASIYLIAIECVMLAYPSKTWLVATGLFLCVASRWWTMRRGWCLNTPLFWNAVFLAVVFAIKFSFAPEVFPSDATFVNTELAHEVGCWLVAFQVLILHDHSSLKRIPPSIAALGCLVILCAGDIQLHRISRNTILILMILFVGGLAWFAHAGREWGKLDQRRRLRRGILLATLVLAGIPTVYAARAWHQHERDLEMLLLSMMRALEGDPNEHRIRSRPVHTQISNGKITDPEKLVLRVTQDSSEPIYLKGATYSRYPHPNANWEIPRRPVELLSPREVPENLVVEPGENLFQLSPSSSRVWTTATIEYLSGETPPPLAPLQASMMKVGVHELRIDSLRNISLYNEILPRTFTVYIPNESQLDEMPGPQDATRQLPDTLSPQIIEIANSIFAGKTSDAEKIRAVEDFFHENFLYHLGYVSPPLRDPITYFLVNRSAAHCEYFAMAAAILLRVGGVPTHYVTGYVPSEHHQSGVWVARRKDAHAWAEAYDSDLQRWVTVEPTPSAGVPERRRASWQDEFAESWRSWSAKFLDLLDQHKAWSAVRMALQTTSVRVFLGLLLVAGWWVMSRRFRRRIPLMAISETTRTFPFQLWLKELETELESRGFERQPQETLLHFRDRILASPQSDALRSTAEWYADYSSIRYNESEQTVTRLAQLELSWKVLATKTK